MENEKDRFYVDLQNDTIEWMYYNPDSNTGGQFVLCKVSYQDFYEGLKEKTNPEDFFHIWKAFVSSIFTTIRMGCMTLKE